MLQIISLCEMDPVIREQGNDRLFLIGPDVVFPEVIDQIIHRD